MKTIKYLLLLMAGLLVAISSGNAATTFVDGWYLNAKYAPYTSIAPGAFSYIHTGGANAALANVGPYNLDVGGTIVFSGTVTNNVSTLLWNGIQFRWGLLNSGGNTFAGTNGIGGSYTNYTGFWAGNPNNNPQPIYELSDPTIAWWSNTGVTNVGASASATGSDASSPPLGTYNFLLRCYRRNAATLELYATLANTTGTYSYSISATDSVARVWTFDRVGMFFSAGAATSGTLYFANLRAIYTNSPVIYPIGKTNSGFRFWWQGPTNQTFQVQASSVLPPSWVTLTNVVTSTNGIFNMIDNNPPSTNRFYRVFTTQ
jgi:hypothetical protein